MLLSLLTKATQPPNLTEHDRAAFLWERFLEKVREALRSTTTRSWTGSTTASLSEATPLSSEISTASGTSSRSVETISFEEEGTTMVDYGKIDDHVILDAASGSANDSRMHSERRHGDNPNWTRGVPANDSAASLRYGDAGGNVKLGDATSDSSKSAKSSNDTSGHGSTAGTEYIYSGYNADARKESSEMNFISVARKDRKDTPFSRLTPSNSSSVGESEAHKRVNLMPMSPTRLAAQGINGRPNEVSVQDARTRGLTNGSVRYFGPPNATKSDEITSLHPEARFLGTLQVVYANSRANVTAVALSGSQFESENRERTEGWSSVGEPRTRQSMAEDLVGYRVPLKRQWPPIGESSLKEGRRFSEGPILNAEASASDPRRHPFHGTGSFKRPRNAEQGDRNTEPFQEDTQPEQESGPDKEKVTTWEVPGAPSMKEHPRDFTPLDRTSRTTMTTTDSFNLLEELDRIANEFTEFFDRKERSERDEDLTHTTIGSEGEVLDADEAITKVVESDGSSATPTEADDLEVDLDARNVGGPEVPGETDSAILPSHDEKDSTKRLADERRNISSGETASPLYCSVGPTYSGPLPPALCSYFMVYDSVYYDSDRKFFQAASGGSWSEVPDSDDRFRLGPRILLVLDADQLRVVVSDFPVAAVFASKAKHLIHEGSLSGLAFDLSLVTDYDVSSYATLLQATMDYMPGYHFVGLIDFIAATGLMRANLAELAGSVHKVFLRNDPRHVHTIGTSVPNPFSSANRRSYSVENAMRLADSLRLVSADRDHVCLSVSLAVYKFNVFDLDVNTSIAPGVGSLASYVNTEFSYSELCEDYRDPHRHFDDATLSTYVHVGKAWLGFDDDMSIEIKIDKLSRKHRVGCLLADNVDLDDFRNACAKGDFPRLRVLKRAVLRERR
ncbi:hypothetical protein HPB50_009054 [Hyalomma asiaticum]|uniref:Uncharacterized protein n=1 Tax=Hyalomma asiaticum TaxID=266040 RepID=A0ACB7SG72_HYAAI|nr:hypothetical protein HPB50_009054 [Hyalomma asiaticum]